MTDAPVTLGLVAVILVVLLAPFLFKRVEESLEVFLLVMGTAAASVSTVWSLHLVEEALVEPIRITATVAIAGLLFYYGRGAHDRAVLGLLRRIPLPLFVFLLVVVLGLVSSVISAIIAALVLVEIVSVLSLGRRATVALTVIACFAIGMGAVLTPLGEPLSTIATSKLEGPPHNADFFFLAKLLWPYVVPGVVAAGVIGAFLIRSMASQATGAAVREDPASIREVLTRTIKVYVFIMALVLLGTGFRPIIDEYFVRVPAEWLYWLNTSSAVLDNATVAAAEIGPSLTRAQIQAGLIAMLVSGVMLIPGNIPNIIASAKLRIGMREWARIGVPVGVPALIIYFLVLFLPGYF